MSIAANSDGLFATKADILAIYVFFHSVMKLWYQYQYSIASTSQFFKAQL